MCVTTKLCTEKHLCNEICQAYNSLLQQQVMHYLCTSRLTHKQHLVRTSLPHANTRAEICSRTSVYAREPNTQAFWWNRALAPGKQCLPLCLLCSDMPYLHSCLQSAQSALHCLGLFYLVGSLRYRRALYANIASRTLQPRRI